MKTTKRRAFFKQSYLLGAGFIASKLVNIHNRLSFPGPFDPGFFFKQPRLRIALDKRSYQSQGVELRIKEIARNKPAVWWLDSFEYCYPNTLDERVFFSNQANLPLAYISANDGYMHLDDSTRQALLYLDLILIDKGIEKLIAGIINCQMLHIRENDYRAVFSIPEGKCLYADRARTENFSIPDFSTETKHSILQPYKIWDQSILCGPICLLYAYWKSGADMNLLSSDWLSVVKLILMQVDDSKYKYQDLIFPVTCNGQSHVIGTCQEMQSVRIFANILIASSLGKLAELCTIDTSLRDLYKRCNALKQEISTAIIARGTVSHSNFGTIYASEIDRAGNTVCMEKIDLQGLIALPLIDFTYLVNPVYKQTRKFCLSYQNVLYQHADIAVSSLFKFHAALSTALTTVDQYELGIELKKVKEFVGDPSIDLDVNSVMAKTVLFNQNILFAELILHLRRINPRLLA